MFRLWQCFFRKFKLLYSQPLAESASKIYPGWRMRIYHNITDDDQMVVFKIFKEVLKHIAQAFSTLCNLYCDHDFVDLCDARNLPVIGDLNTQFPIGRFWRFQVWYFSLCNVVREDVLNSSN